MKLKCRINGIDYDIVQGATFIDNFNETLDSATICIDQVSKINNLSPYDDVYIWKADETFIGYPNNGGNPLPSFFKHMLIDSFSEEMLALENDLYRYQISLFSETKKLEKVILPNISITQSLKQEEKRTCWFYLKKYIELYSPKYKKILNVSSKTWEYAQKYSISETGTNHDGIIENLKALFDDTICPEMSFTNPSLREVLSQIMIVKDVIPFVKNDVIYGLDIGNKTGAFERESGNNRPVNFTSGSMSSSEFATDARREYGNALSQENSARCIEYIGFRNPDSTFLDLADLSVQTRYPIYKINKFKICYYKNYEIRSSINPLITLKRGVFLCKHDMTKLVLQNVVRNCLSTNWSSYINHDEERTVDYSQTELVEGGLDFAKQFKLCTVGYDIGSNEISGWGTTYEYLNFLWFKSKRTYIENIVELLEHIDPDGISEISDVGTVGDDITKSELMSGYEGNILVPGVGFGSILALSNNGASDSNISNKIKSIFFEIDYDAFYNGTITHSKDDIEKDDITTVDNCSSALTVLELDGLQQKEKLDRLGNKIFKFTARYDADNGGATYSRVQNVGTYDAQTNSIVYMREYQIYDNLILANYEATHEYVLKNYFTSVWAKYRTYSLMSYGESVKRSENNRQLVLLSDNKKYFEENDANSNGFTKSLLSALIPTNISDYGLKTNNDKINAGYFHFQEGTEQETGKQYGGYFLSDINSFACGESICFNISMEDNISGGNYVKNLSDSIEIFNEDEGSYGTEYKTVQNWWQMVSSSSDAFSQNIGVYVCHFDKNSYFAPLKTTSQDVTSQTNIRRFFDLPKFEYSSSYVTKEIGQVYQLCKDNKEIVDFTFQFDFITQRTSNFLISSWFCKLNDLIGAYEKYPENSSYISDTETDDKFQYFIWNYKNEGQDLAGFNMAIKIKKTIFDNLDFESVTGISEMSTQWYYVNSNYSWFFATVPGALGLLMISNVNAYANLCFSSLKSIVQSENKSLTLTWHLNGTRSISTSFLGAIPVPALTFDVGYFDSRDITLNFLEEDGDYYWFKGRYTGNKVGKDSYSIMYQDRFNKEWYNNFCRNVKFWWECEKQGDDDVHNLNSSNSFTGEGGFFEGPVTKSIGKNMYIFTSNKKLNKELIYSFFEENSIPSNFKKEDVRVDDVFKVGSPEVTDLFRIDVNADLFSETTIDGKQVKSVQYYYKDEKNVYHFVCGINLKEDSEGYSIFGIIPIYLSLINKRDMTVYDSEHRPIGTSSNYLNTENDYGTGQHYDDLEILPNGYTKVQYLKGNGNSYVPTNITLTYDSSIEVECERTDDSGNDTVIAGSNNSLLTSTKEISLTSTEEGCDFVFGNSNKFFGFEEGEKVKLSAKAGVFYYDDELIGGTIQDDLSVVVGKVYLFALGGRNIRSHKRFNGKIYSFKVGEMIPGRIIRPGERELFNKITHALIPCIRNYDNKPGVYDINDNVFYPGEGDFEYEI